MTQLCNMAHLISFRLSYVAKKKKEARHVEEWMAICSSRFNELMSSTIVEEDCPAAVEGAK